MRWFLALVIGLVAVAAVAAVVYDGDPNNAASASIGTTVSQTGSSTIGTTGLQFRVSLNSSQFAQGQTVKISVEDYNPNPGPDNVSAASDWALPYLTLGPCGTLNEPDGYAILSGYYTASNASSATALQLYQPAYYPCPAMMGGIRSYGFLPMNSSAELYAACSSGPCFSLDTNVTSSYSGYWTGTIGSSSFGGFPPGVYTVVAGDEWGDLMILHFSVG